MYWIYKWGSLSQQFFEAVNLQWVFTFYDHLPIRSMESYGIMVVNLDPRPVVKGNFSRASKGETLIAQVWLSEDVHVLQAKINSNSVISSVMLTKFSMIYFHSE